MNTDFLPYGRQSIDEADIDSVVEVLRSAWITQGPIEAEFEEALADYCGAAHAVAVSSGTAALHLAYLTLGLQEGDELISSPNTFVATTNAAVYCGAMPRFVDIDPRTYNLDTGDLAAYLAQKPCTGQPKVVVPVHFAGQPCEMESIREASSETGMAVVEDACHALGATWQDVTGAWQRVGNCSHSDMTVFSFHPVKHITTGLGGAILTNDEDHYHHLKELCAHGITKDPQRLDTAEPWYYEMRHLGYNYRMTDFQCALGLSQLKKSDGWVRRRRQIAEQYDHALESIDELILPYQMPNTKSSFHLYVIQIRDCGPARHRAIFECLRGEGIGVQVHYIPVHLQPYYSEQFGCLPGDFPKAEGYYSRCLSLPIFPNMLDLDVDRVVQAVSRVVTSL